MSKLTLRKYKILILSLSVTTFNFISFTAFSAESNLAVATAQYQEVDRERVLDALVEAVNKATVSAQTSGRVSKIYFDVNDYAKKGDVLLRMRDADQQAGLKVAEANFNQANTESKRVNDLFAKN